MRLCKGDLRTLHFDPQTVTTVMAASTKEEIIKMCRCMSVVLSCLYRSVYIATGNVHCTYKYWIGTWILHIQIKFMGVARAFLLWHENEANVHMQENMHIFLQLSVSG